MAVASRSPETSSHRVLSRWIFTLVLLSSPIGMATVLPGVLEEEERAGPRGCLVTERRPANGIGHCEVLRRLARPAPRRENFGPAFSHGRRPYSARRIGGTRRRFDLLIHGKLAGCALVKRHG